MLIAILKGVCADTPKQQQQKGRRKSRFTKYDEKKKQYIRLASRLAVDNKLGKLEDLEEQLGCPLEVVVKALKIGIYTNLKNWNREDLTKYFCLNLYNLETEWYLGNPIIFVNLKDYKKTWWLREDKSEQYVHKNKRRYL